MKMVSLDSIAEFVNGYAFKPTDWMDTGRKIIRIQNLTNSDKGYNRTTKNVPQKYVIKKNDILVSWSATLGVFEWNDDEDGLLNQHIFKVNPDLNQIDKSYFKYVLRYSIDKMTQFTHGSTMKHIVRGDFLKHTIPLPSLETQKQIVDILNNASLINHKRKQSISALDEYLKSTFYEMFGDLDTNIHGWDISKLSYVTKKVTDGTHQPPKFVENGIPFIFISNIVNNEITLNTKKFISEATYGQLTKSTPIEIGDILYTTVGSYGHPALVKSSEKFCFQRHIAHIKPDSTKINTLFLYGMLKSPMVRRQADEKAKGIAQKTLNLSDLKDIKVFLPSIELQNKYAEITLHVEALKKKMISQSEELEKQFQALMQKAFN